MYFTAKHPLLLTETQPPEVRLKQQLRKTCIDRLHADKASALFHRSPTLTGSAPGGTLPGTLPVDFGTLQRKIWTELTCLDGTSVERNSLRRTTLAEYPRQDSNL